MNWITPQSQAHEAIRQALDAGVSPAGLPAALLLERGTLKLYFYAPRGTDPQPVHDQDEVYVVATGSGTFASGNSEDRLDRMAFGRGDAIFVPAGTIHRFVEFTDDFATWVIMYGPEGGEVPAGHPG